MGFLGDIGGMLFGLIVIALIVWLIVTNIRIVPQAHAFVIERLGAYNCTWQVGIHFKIPLIDKVAKKSIFKRKCNRFFTAAGNHKGQCNNGD